MTSLCLNQWPTGRAQEHTSGRVARFWAAPCGLWGLLMALQLGRGPGQRWMEEAGRRPRSTRSGLGRWMGKKGQQPGTSLVPPAHKSTCRSQERPLSPTGVERVGGLQPASAAFPRPENKWGVGGLASRHLGRLPSPSHLVMQMHLCCPHPSQMPIDGSGSPTCFSPGGKRDNCHTRETAFLTHLRTEGNLSVPPFCR